MSATFGGGGGIAGFQYKHLQANESIQAFLRSFLHEKHRWNELIEAMLLYGIHCMAQNYSLQTLNVDQVQHITRTLLRKPHHYFVHQQKTNAATTSTTSAFKPPSAWRNGTSSVDDGAVRSGGIDDSSDPLPPPPAPFSHEKQNPPSPVVRDGRRDMDEWTHVLGKPWVDAAWRAYVAATGYPCPSITTSSDSILHSYADLIAATSSIVVTNNHIHIPSSSHLSFLDYLRGFVVHCINSPARPSPTPPSIAAASKPSPQPRHAPPLLSSSSKAVPPQSKVKHELDRHKQHVLRVRKTNTQRMHEALARSRIAAYDPPVRRAAMPPASTPSLAATGPGAKALEIAHVFATSQFMHDLPPSTENDDPTINDTPAQRMLRTELYGHHDLNPSTLQATGCVAPPDRRQSNRRNVQPNRIHDFKGWLGDYGPAHTKTVAPPDWTDLEDEGSAWLQDAARRRGYSWDLERYY
ncbi:hypothetical protein, variant 1 [Aphanomyces astaci]|uniref:Uncharacterized protein n=1 Tax=Aphanomyces astaci TaxID=112090 RepID=W4FS39_APHAT|nr:hypothetical protein, variant 1 [Aphanomyces astaci]ETV70292.1 hypothetical protein, variant 1 [Aphanomyces astaci]|eukprot:XP_009840250.1 hypothetical protein, variant 1 [Aphanomyces astaci]